MFFRKKEKEHELEDIKEAVEEPLEAEEYPSFPKSLPPAPQMPSAAVEVSAPLFVKVDKYREVLRSLQEMKLFVGGVKQTFTVLHEIESIRADALNIMRATVQRLEKSLTQVDTDLLRPKGVSLREMGVADTEVRHLEESLTDLQKQLADLRQELQGLG